jgi:hypothetical protein
VLVYPDEEKHFEKLAQQFRAARSHIPVRLVPTLFPIDSQNDHVRALEHAVSGVRGRWLVVLEPDVILDRFGIETALEFAGSNEVSAVALWPGVRCRTSAQRIVAASMEQLRQIVRFAHRRLDRNRPPEAGTPFLLLNREAFEVVNRINRLPGILNDAGWSIWGYHVESLRTFEGDGARWMWRGADVHSWFSDTQPDRIYGLRSAAVVVGSAVMAWITVFGFAYAWTQSIDNFTGASIFAFSAVSYLLMAVSYFLFARRLGAAAWFAPFWLLSHLPASVLALVELRRLSRLDAESKETVRKAHTLP